MAKRFLVGGILAVVIVGLGLIYFFSRTSSFDSASAAQAVSDDAILFADNIDFYYFTGEFSNENQIWNELRESSRTFQNYDSSFQDLSNIIESLPLLKRSIESGSLSLSIHLMGKSKLAAVFYLKPADNITMHDLEKEIETLLGVNAIINERKYEAVNLKDVSLSKGSTFPTVTYGNLNGLLILSSSSILVEDAIRNLNSEGGISHTKGFKNLEGTIGKYVHANIYINFHLLDQLFYPAVENSSWHLLQNLAGIAGLGELDADLNIDALVFNGMTYTEDSLAQYLNLFRGQAPVKLEAISMIPSNTSLFLWAGISDLTLFKNKTEEYYTKQGRIQEFRSTDSNLEKKYGINPFNDLLEVIKDEIFWLKMDASDAGPEYEVVGIEVNSRSEAINRLKGWTQNYAEGKGIDPSRLVSQYLLDDQTSFEIYQLPEKMYTGFFQERFIKSYFAFYDRYVFFSDSKAALERTIYQNVLHKTLDNELAFGKINNYLSSKGNLCLYIRPDRFLESNSGLFDKEATSLLSSIEPVLKKIPGILFQFVSEGDMFYSNVTLKYNSQVKERSLTEWESLLDSTAVIKPVIVINHNTSEKEIIVQDAANALYLINSTGRILWKVKLGEKIKSEIYQLDYYRNGKLQYLFSTVSGIHLIDRNGNYVERYPVKFRSDATNGIAFFDYDNIKDYRIFVACADRKVYVYDIEGNIIPGWDFSRTEGVVEKPIQHFRLKEKDYIVFSDPIRAYILDRRGKERVKQKDLAMVSENNMFYLDMNPSGDKPRLITTDTSGNVIGVDFNGNIELILKNTATRSHFFRTKDLNQDGEVEYIFADGNELKVIDSEGERFFSFKIKNDIEMLPDIYQFSSSDLKIGITDQGQNRIYLFNSDGSVYEGFPLEGNTRFSIGYFGGSDSRFNLIVGSANGFIYNYSIE